MGPDCCGEGSVSMQRCVSLQSNQNATRDRLHRYPSSGQSAAGLLLYLGIPLPHCRPSARLMEPATANLHHRSCSPELLDWSQQRLTAITVWRVGSACGCGARALEPNQEGGRKCCLENICEGLCHNSERGVVPQS